MENWTKLYGSILDSSVWQLSKEAKLVWITLLAMKDEGGRVWAAMPGLAKRAGVTLEECEEAMRLFERPDEYSRSQEYEGRRVEKIDRGWLVLNHHVYRDEVGPETRRAYWRRMKAKQRARKNGDVSDYQVDRKEDPEGHVMQGEKGIGI